MVIMTAETKGDVLANSASSISDNTNITGYIFIGVIILIAIFLFFLAFIKKKKQNIEDAVIVFSFGIALSCLTISVCFNESEKSINLLSFFGSFIFSWLLTKKSSKEEFKERQQEIAKTSYRHIGDVKKATLVTKNRLLTLMDKENILKSDIYGILDDVDIILQCIATNEGDWQDMVSESYLSQIKKDNDPEDEDTKDNKEINQPTQDDLEALRKKVIV